eukprot:11224636-Lingulodinium_polyedra.AAC.1
MAWPKKLQFQPMGITRRRGTASAGEPVAIQRWDPMAAAKRRPLSEGRQKYRASSAGTPQA